MLFKTFLSSFVSLVLIRGACAIPQVTTALPFVVDGDELIDTTIDSGVIVGTGADGTTFVISEATETVTFVENASQVELFGAVTTSGVGVFLSVGCGISGGSGDCTEVFAATSGSISFSTVITTSGILAQETVIVSTSSGSGTSNSASAASPTQSSSAIGKHLGGGLMATIASLLLGAAIMV